MTMIVRLALLSVLLAAAPALAADVTNLLGTPAVTEDELGAHRAKGEEVPLDQATNPGPTGFPGALSGHGAPSAGGAQSNSYNVGSVGGGRNVAAGIQAGSVGWTR